MKLSDARFIVIRLDEGTPEYSIVDRLKMETSFLSNKKYTNRKFKTAEEAQGYLAGKKKTHVAVIRTSECRHIESYKDPIHFHFSMN